MVAIIVARWWANSSKFGLLAGLGTKSPTSSAASRHSTILDMFSAKRLWNKNRVNEPSSRQLLRIRRCLVSLHIVPLPEPTMLRSEEHTSELQSQSNLVCRLLL